MESYAIETRFRSATITRGTRIQATCAGVTACLLVPYNYAVGESENYRFAAAAFVNMHLPHLTLVADAPTSGGWVSIYTPLEA